eukprot:6745450-Prymnesium_polylepis.1
MSSGVDSLASAASTKAEESSKSCAVATWPFCAATKSGVVPFFTDAITGTPCSRSTSTVGVWPLEAARKSADAQARSRTACVTEASCACCSSSVWTRAASFAATACKSSDARCAGVVAICGRRRVERRLRKSAFAGEYVHAVSPVWPRVLH